MILQKPFPGKEIALQKLQRYCAFQERCHQEVRQKLYELSVYGDLQEEIVAELISENFLNEERFARTYARGKFRTRSWGRIRIQQELKQRKVSEYCIRKGMEEIEEEEYLKALQKIIAKKQAELAGEEEFAARQKTAQYAMRKGFESELIWAILRE
ncbi:regulatory protein RecX [Haliscomenobacter hydrossis]|uniref:Regulatory protein RecX n=1 Tax=Haliscomenobacter hydrossis (strain ATCC 27775 / DSM 1100 / LMG 10767 / O) TaxID=760192 RepID=F4L1G7_HALH1|nr:regulatory protein RecX [Haliscomenobacter hydrossis]AEE53864.1 regulatory protein RecX [Haliscomenobacter hydrossis DSM 1100]